MNTEKRQWDRLWQLFEEALGMDPRSAPAFLDEACGDDRELRRELDSLLASHRRAGSFIDQAVGAVAGAFVSGGAPQASLEAGRRIGPWEILRPIGKGGMGAVYLVVRSDDQFRQQGALKLSRGGVHGPELLRRFRAERQILADLDHPNIARLLDGGATGDGTPWVVMEYVDGERIDTWCDARRLDLRSRLRLFRQVCAAVQHAHRSLVVHRDIKPANILVGPDGSPKLLDFGIAKLIDPGAAADGAADTGLASRFLTPDYASPEQVRGEPITTATDVYSLGVLLYQLLTGRLPCTPATDSAADLVRAVCETAPQRPSLAVTRGEPAAGRAAAPDTGKGRAAPEAGYDPVAASRARGTTPSALRRELRGDLDTILLMALRKEPARRYPTVDQLSEDIQRYLEGRPVAARPDTWGYRARKFVRRNPLGAVAAAAIALLVTTLAVSMTWQSIRIAGERDRARAAESRATTEAATARRVSDFLVDLFGGVDPAEARGREVTAREILDRGAARVRTELKDQPEIQARLQETMGTIYGKLGVHDEARPLLEASLRRRLELYGEDHPEVARARVALGSLLQTLGEYDEADRLLTAALETRRARPGTDPNELINSLEQLSSLRSFQGRYQDGEAFDREALEIARGTGGDRSKVVSEVLANMGGHLEHMGRYQEAESAYREALDMQRELIGEDHPSYPTTLGLLARLLSVTDRYEESRELCEKVLELQRRIFGERHLRVATALNNLASTLKEMGELDEAERRQREALEMYRAILGDEHYMVAMSYNNLANILQDKGDLDGAEATHRVSLALHRKIFGDEHPRVADCLNNYANLLWDKGDYEKAEPLYREALALDRKLLGDDHDYVAMDLSNLALVLRDRGKLEEALSAAEEAIEISGRSQGPESAQAAGYVTTLASILERMGRAGEAEERIEWALGIQEKELPEGHWRLFQTRGLQGEILAALGRNDEAERLMIEAHDALEEQLGPLSGMTRRVGEALGRFYRSTGRPEKAAAYASSR